MGVASVKIEPACITLTNPDGGYEMRLHTVKVEEVNTGELSYLGAWHLGLDGADSEAALLLDASRAEDCPIDDRASLEALLNRRPASVFSSLVACVAGEHEASDVRSWFDGKWRDEEDASACLMPGFFPADLPFPSPLECRMR